MTISRLLCVFLVATSVASAAESLQDRLASAKPGKTITLPAGEFRGGLTIPAGVSLKGAGYGKTIIDAGGAENGLKITGGEAVISDLTVCGAAGANVLVQDAQKVTLRRVRSMGALIGVSMSNVKSGRIENVIADGNRYGIVVTGGEGNVVVNCTMAGNAALGLSLPSGKGATAFNNLLSDSATAVLIGDEAEVTLDHNLYLGFNIGKFHAQGPRNTLSGWQFMSGQDAHSISIPVTYQDVSNGVYKVTNVLDWAQDRTVTAQWGASKLASHQAPTEDIDGVKRPASPGVGAYEVTAQAPRPADGKFTVSSDDRFISAGVFDAKGKLVTYLFQALPLPKGTHSFWLPSRSWRETPIAAGDYEVRVLESKLGWRYVGFVGNTGDPNSAEAAAPAHPDALAFDNDGRLAVARDINEGHIIIRAYDGATGKFLWLFHGTSNQMNGLATAADGWLYSLRIDGKAMRVSRVDPATGDVVAWGKNDYGSMPLKGPAIYTGLAALGKHLFYTDTANNALRIGTTDAPDPVKAVEVKAPTSPAADAKSGVVWVISDGAQLVALSPEGKVLGQSQDVPAPVALAARDGRLAVASAKTGKIHLFDCTNPAQLKSLGTLGRGDGPNGLVMSDRFLFQDNAMPVVMAIGPQHQLAVGEEEGRVQVFDKDNKLVWSSFSAEGGGGVGSKVTPGRLYVGYFTYQLDGEKGTWQLESYHRHMNQGRNLGEFQVNGQTYLAFLDVRPEASLGNQANLGRLVFMKFTPEKLTPAGGFTWKWGSAEPWTFRYDDNHDGRVDLKDQAVSTLTDAQGKPAFVPMGDNRFISMRPNGELVQAAVAGGWLVRWPCAGLDKQGAPMYRFTDRAMLKGDADAIISPYDHKPSVAGCGDHVPRAGDEWVCLARASSAPWKVMINNGGADLVGLDKNGGLNWFRPFANINVIGSLKGGDGVYLAAMADTYDCLAVNDDGLSMNGLCPAEKAEYVGNWVDDPTGMRTFIDKQGKLNVLMMDYVIRCCDEWYRLEKKEVHAAKFPLTVTAPTAATLAALAFKPFDVTAGKPATPVVHIPRLKEPLKIDGNLQKWRDAGITPQLIITPETSAGIEGGPRDCNAVIRLAWCEQDLYLQVLRFDDVIASHQPRERAYLQDTVEMAVNGIWEGIKHNLSMTTDAGPVNQVDGWKLDGHTLDRNDSPIVINVLPNAETVSERKLIESIYGVDMSKCKVQVFETRIPMNDKTYAGRLPAKLELKPGLKFWLGFMIDDNDNPGTDLQNLIFWPVTYGTTTPKEQHGLAILD